MSKKWLALLKFNPIPTLLSSSNEAIKYFTRRDLLDETIESITYIWDLPEVQKIFRKQQLDGSWNYTGKKTVSYPKYHYSLVETWKSFFTLVDKYQVNKLHEGIRKGSEFLFSCQTKYGDIRGILANQYATYYTGAILSLLIKIGYENDDRVQKGLVWLLSMRQDDGGWTIPILTHTFNREEQYRLTSQFANPIEPDRAKPFSHNWTDMVLRAFAVHSRYRYSKEARVAADLLKSSFFQPDNYSSYGDARYWVRFLFWWPNLVTALDLLSLMSYSPDDKDIKKGLDWLIKNQLPNGLWNLDYSQKRCQKLDVTNLQLWLTLKVAKIFKIFYG